MRGFLNFAPKPVDHFEEVEPDISAGPDYSGIYRALPFDSQPANVINTDLSTVDPLAGIKSPGGPLIPTQDVFNDLDTLRLKMPWLPITLFPPLIRTAFMPVAGIAADISVPTGAAIVQFSGPGDFWFSVGGRAAMPTAANIGNGEGASLYKSPSFFYCGNVKQVSVVSPGVNAIVHCAFWTK